MGHLVTVLQKKKIIVQDGFNRADNAASLGNANTGQVWAFLSSAWGILNNKAYSVGTTLTEIAYQESRASDVLVSTNLVFSSNEGLVVRLTDNANHLIARISSTGLGLFRMIAASPIQIGNYAFTSVAGATYALKVICSGPFVKVYLDGLEVISVSETFNRSATLHGLRTSASSGARFDDFKVEVLT